MSKKIALVGHCGPDSSFMRMAVSSADKTVRVLMADDDETLVKVLNDGVDLLLINRELPYGFDETLGVETIKKIRAHHPAVKAMLISNYPEAQQEAVKASALPGFGKREIGTPRVTQVLREALASDTVSSA